MKINKAITIADELRPGNSYNQKFKIRWLSELDSKVTDEIFKKHEVTKESQFNGYDDKTSSETELLMPDEFSEAYIHWIHAKIDLFNRDEERYQISMAAFLSIYGDYAKKYNRDNMPVSTPLKLF